MLLTTEPTITIDFLIQVGLVLMALWAFVKVVGEVIEAVNKRHDREQKWDEYAKNLEEERNKIYEKYDKRFDEVEQQIADNSTDPRLLYLQRVCRQF